MRVTMMLCDHAQVAEGKLYISGGGWSVTGPGPAPSAVALKIDVPWDRTNRRVSMLLRLLDEDGQPVTQEGRTGPEPVQFGGEFEVGRPPGLKAGAPIDVPLAMNVPPLQLAPGRRFTWELQLDGVTHPDWQLSFSTRPAGGTDA
jgi:hypothetical protein